MIWPILLGLSVGFGPDVDYARDVKPVLAARCTSCHGAIRQKAGLRLDTAELVRRGGDSGPAIEPGQSGESLLFERVSAAGAERMPPQSEGAPLKPDEIAAIRSWIDRGAPAPAEPTPEDPRRHWAFQPVRRPEVPVGSSSSWSRNPVDALLAAKHRGRGLTPAAPVGKDLWLRRVTLDLIGLLPSSGELRAFRADTSPQAEDRVIDRLLASPRYGERWARHWMDVWRYSDWYGLGQEVRFSQPHLWHWRDWIIASLNADKGYDRMVLEMLAGDELAPDDPDSVRATGFLARNWNIFNRNVWLADTVEHTSRAFLGLTIQCARCHDHKFDPISQVDYYRLRAVFEPYHIRTDRVPGQPDRNKDGLPRAFDDFLDRPTFLFVRGDEARPDKEHPLKPGIPALFGGDLPIAQVPLPQAAYCPDKRPFVIAETRAAADLEVAAASREAERARGQAARAETERAAARDGDTRAQAEYTASLVRPDRSAARRDAAAQAVERLYRAERAAEDACRDRVIAEAELAAAQARRTALLAVLDVERLEDDGGKSAHPESWARSARAAAAAQAQARLADARAALLRTEREVQLARRALESLAPDTGQSKDAALRKTRTEAAQKLVEKRAALDQARAKERAAEETVRRPPGTDYAARALAFPRAKVTYRDEPSNAAFPRTSTGRRLALARWIMDRRNPLSARVAVNHIWARHFGEPLVEHTSDFGLRSPRPELADLLDWLAVELVESGWSQKHLHRLIVSSAAYRMRSSSGSPSDASTRIDRDNRLFWRMNPRRMEGEVIRDCLLELSNRLDTVLGGPEQPIDFAASGTRRSLYYRTTRDERIPLLNAFDPPNVEDCYRRFTTIVPQQALALLNDEMTARAAGRIATIISRSATDDPGFVVAAFERILGRPPEAAEQTECLKALERLSGRHDPAGESRARAAIVHVLINHNDFVTIR